MSVASRPRAQATNDAWIALGIAILLILAALGARAYIASRPETVTVTPRDIVVFLPLDGRAVAPPTERADITAAYRAPVAKVYVSVGQKVARGTVLVELALPNAQAAYEQARQSLKEAEAAYQTAPRQYSAALQAAKQQLAAARAAEAKARAAVAVTVQPTDTGAAVAVQAPAPDLATATAARITAEQALLQAQAEMKAALAPYQQRLEAAQEAFREAQTGRKMAMIRAPISGTVLALNARPGIEVGTDPKTPVATIVNLSALQVHAEMNAAAGGASDERARSGGPGPGDSVKPGEAAVLTFKELPGQQFEGQVSRITTEPSRPLVGERYIAIVEFKNEQGLVKPDMTATVRVKLGEAHNAVAVPSAAIHRDESGRPVVEVLRNGRWQTVVVEVGLSDGRYTAIRSGLKPGETVRVSAGLL